MNTSGLASMRSIAVRDGRVEMMSATALPSTHRPADGMIVIRPTCALLTPLEREVARGLRSKPNQARVLGHAFTAVVEDAMQSSFTRGSRVVINPVLSCGSCERCRSGLSMHCATRTIVGIDAVIGGLSDLIEIPAANCLLIPKDLDDDRAVFAAPLARAIEAVRRGGVDKRTYASVLGDDLCAILTTLIAVEENPLARLVAMHESTIRAAEQFGIRHRALHEIGRRGDQELVIDTTGSAETVAAAARMVRPRGHVVLAGISASAPVAFDLSHIALDEIEVHGSGFGPLNGALERLARRTIDPSALISRRVSFADAPKALPMLNDPSVFSVLVQVSR
jgi:threonine dehydrogenase-like Zn-dependent dehydrogenase